MESRNVLHGCRSCYSSVWFTTVWPPKNLVASQLRCRRRREIVSERMIYKPKGQRSHTHTDRERE